MSCWGIIVAAGQGTRFDTEKLKQFVSFAGRPLFVWSVAAFAGCDEISQVVVAVPEDAVERAQELLADRGFARGHVSGAKTVVCAGGPTRKDSVRMALKQVPKEVNWVAVHDGARPLVTVELISRVVLTAKKRGAAIPVLPISDTVKSVVQGQVSKTVDRSALHVVQTPQAFSRELLWQAHQVSSATSAGVTDDAQLVEGLGVPVWCVAGDSSNLKVTVPADLERAAVIAEHSKKDKKDKKDKPMNAMRGGCGYDVHRLAPGERLVLGGVEIPHSHGLCGHSDADVLAHAVADALLGAAALGDIGTHFPATDPQFKGADSLELLAQVVQMVSAQGLGLGNLDCVLICEKPQLSPHIPQMRANLARVLKGDLSQISVKATTSEGLGFVGQGLGIAVQATVLLQSC